MRGKMRDTSMKKLLVVPLSVVTVLLVVAFLTPGSVAGTVGKLSSSVHLSIGGLATDQAAGAQTVDSQAAGTQVGQASSGSGSAKRSGSSGSTTQSAGLTSRDLSLIETVTSGGDPPVAHHQGTRSHDNCGRYGNGLHGGKHMLICPNHPF